MSPDVSLSIHPDEMDMVEEFADEVDFVEVYFTSRYPESDIVVDDVEEFTDENDITVNTVHGTRISDMGTLSGFGSLKGKTNNVLLDYGGTGQRVPRPGMSDLQVLNFHAPYEDDEDLPEDEMLLNTLRNVFRMNQNLRDRGLDTVITLENSANSRNLISSISDVERTIELAEGMDEPVEEELYFTYDAVHHPDPAMPRTMGERIRNVHISDFMPTDDPDAKPLQSWIDPDYDFDDPVDMRERDGIYTHLPVGRGDLDYKGVLDVLTGEIGYDGPVTVEMDRSVKNEETWRYSREVLESYLE